MLELFLTPASISFLSLFLLTLIITIYLAGFYLRHRSLTDRRQGLILLAFFFTLLLLSLCFFLEHALLPSARFIPTWSESPILSLLITLLILFAYHFPAPDPRQRIERWIAVLISCAITYWELSFDVYRLQLVAAGRVEYRPMNMDYARIVEFVWVIFIFGRSFIRNWKVPAVRNFALILLIPLGLAILETGRNIDPAVTAIFPISLSIGLLFTTYFFALNYLNAQPQQISFVVKVSGVVLTSILVIFGSLAWLVAPVYAAGYVSPAQSLDHTTLLFSPDGQGGYQVSAAPFHWQADRGNPAADQLYDFPFPFFGQAYQKVSFNNCGAIGVGGGFSFTDFQNNFNPIPMIFPLLKCLISGTAPDSGMYVRQDPDELLITWYRMQSDIDGSTFTYQTALYSDGSLEFSYNDLPRIQYAVDDQPDSSVWVIGIKPAKAPPGTARFTGLPMHVGPEGALQDEFRAFRGYIDQLMRPLAVGSLAGSLVFVLGLVLLLSFSLARPLKSLLKGVQNFNQGQRNQGIPISSNDEIGFLTESFNHLAGELNDLIASLEKRVAQRTQELSAANTRLQAEMEARARAQEEVVEHQRAVATLEERERLARELHDGIGQVLGFLNVQAQSANDSVQSGDRQAASQLLSRMAEVAQEAHDDVRGYILGLKKDAPAQPGPDFFSRLEDYRQHLSQSYGFQTALNLPAEIPPVLASSAVEAQLLYVIREALSNACAHSGQKQAEVTISFDESHIRAAIEDHGVGFTEKKRGGHFGLEIMRQRTETLGGTLEIDSAPGSGTRVLVCLPRQLEGGAAGGLRLLLVDDHPLFLEGLANLVAGRGMTVAGTASDGLEAQEKARTLRPDVILMDIEMPRCDGLEATRRIKAEMPEVKVVMLTVSGEERHLFEALQFGASGYLLKSLEASELTGLLEELLRGEVSLSPDLAGKMLEAFTAHKAPPARLLGLPPEKESSAAEPAAPVELTPRQTEILRLVAQGCQYKEIALQLGLAEVTIKYHMGEILARLHLSSRREAVQYFQNGKLP